MQFQSLALLMFAAVLVMGQEERPQRDRQRQFAASRPRRSAGPARQLVQPTISKHEQQMDIEWPSSAPFRIEKKELNGHVKGTYDYIDETGTLQVLVLEYNTGKSAANKSGSFWTSAVLKPFPINPAQSQGGRQRQLAARRLRSLSGPTRQRIQPTITNQEQQVDNELPIRAPALSKPVRPQSTRTSVEAEERPKKPSVETIRPNPTQRDGSFTFGYENADGSFKEGTRGPDCVVHGRSGNIEEGGTNRGFTYQTGKTYAI